MKNVLAVLSTDWHLKDSNAEQIIELVRDKCKLAEKHDCKLLIAAGDIFDARKGQSVTTLMAFSRILEIIDEYNLQLIAISGNHDKQSYESDYSFLTPYRVTGLINLDPPPMRLPTTNNPTHFYFLPFYKEEIWLEKYKKLLNGLDSGRKNVLISHTAITGSVNNDGSKVETGIKPVDFVKFDLVLLGHYHDYQQVSENIFHIPSIQQNNFGEDQNKGYTLLYDDLTFDIVKSNFKPYEKVVIDVDKVSKKELAEYVKTYQLQSKNIRFELVGSSENIKAVNKESITMHGIDVKAKVKEVEKTIEYYEDEIKEFDDETIVESFIEYCEQEGIDNAVGLDYLQKKLKNELK